MHNCPIRTRQRAAAQWLSAIAFVTGFVSLQAEVTDPAVLKTRNWDQSVIIGPGGYRGVKTVTTENQKHRIEPGALVEKAHFDGKRNPQWEITGALVRESKFNGDLGAHLTAKDSAFEACNFSKSGGWFVAWWGTKWRFENCVFTKSFMGGGLGVHDYSVRAVDCTFIGLQLPNFGLKNPVKDEPAKYLGKADLQFVRCKFIGCDVPENALVTTVDCVFEDCKFEKGKFAWDKAKGPIKVTAFVASGRQPQSYTNGQLQVTFSPAGPAQAAGAKIPFTQTGGRILLPWAQQITKFNDLGVEDKLASTVPVFNIAANATGAPLPKEAPKEPSKEPPKEPPTPPTPPVIGPNSFFNIPGSDPVPKPKTELPPVAPTPIPAAAPPAPAEKSVRTFDELLAALPIDLNLLTNAKINPAAGELANAALDKAAAGKPALFRVTVEELRGYKENGYAFMVLGQGVPIRVKGLAATAKVAGLFRASHAAALSRVGKGNSLTIRGVISKAELTGSERNLTFGIVIGEAEIQ